MFWMLVQAMRLWNVFYESPTCFWLEFDLILYFRMKLIYEELLERAKEKEEKEAKKRQRLADEFTKLLYTFKVSQKSLCEPIW